MRFNATVSLWRPLIVLIVIGQNSGLHLLMRILLDGALRDTPLVALVVTALVVCALITDPTHKPIRQFNIYFFARRRVSLALWGFLPAVRRGVEFSLQFVDAFGTSIVLPTVLLNEQVKLAALFNGHTLVAMGRPFKLLAAKCRATWAACKTLGVIWLLLLLHEWS